MSDQSMTRERVSVQMRERLRANRFGKLTSSQWKDMVTAPLTTLLILLAPALLLLGPRVVALSARWLLIGGVIFLAVLLVTTLFRARRYARAPIYFDTLYAPDRPLPPWLFWRPQILQTASGEAMRFERRLAPYVRLQPNQPYLVYYLREPGYDVLLSIAPAQHPDAAHWQPTEAFYDRQRSRA